MTDSPLPPRKPRPEPEAPSIRPGWAIFAVLTLGLPFALFAALKAHGPMTPPMPTSRADSSGWSLTPPAPATASASPTAPSASPSASAASPNASGKPASSAHSRSP